MAAMLHQNPFSFSKEIKTTVDIIEDNKVLYLAVKEKNKVLFSTNSLFMDKKCIKECVVRIIQNRIGVNLVYSKYNNKSNTYLK